MKTLFNKKDISPTCEYCSYGKISPDNETILCIKKGVVEKTYACKRFKYDPLKRQPRRPKAMEKFSEEDFSLE